MATYLVTGAAGFIASKVAEFLLADGHTVVGLDNLNDYYDVRLKYYRLARLAELSGCDASQVASLKEQVTRSDPQVSGFRFQVSFKSDRFEFHTLDIEDLPALERVFERSDFSAVFNLAARAGVRYSLEFPELYRRTNVLGEENVLKCQVKYGVKKHVLASSSSVYAGCPMPFVEDAVLGKMQSPYAETKRQAELLALDYHQKHGIDVTALRYFTVFGPAGRPDMAPFRFIKWIDEGTPITLYGDGTQARDFTYVDDIARGTILAVKPLGYEVINLGGGNNPITLHTMIGWIEKTLIEHRAPSAEPLVVKALINHLPPSAADMTATWADITKAKRLLGWSPGVTPAEGFGYAVDWHMQNARWVKDISV